MHWRTTQHGWGAISILIHWTTVLVVFGLFGLGLWMVDLTYYDAWYHEAPALHKSIGILLFILTLLRIIWRRIEGKPAPLPTHSATERVIARRVHMLIYVLLISIMLFGYLIPTADGRPIEVFDWFVVPATLHGIHRQEDIAGAIHLWLAVILISLVIVHALGALKHHLLDKDPTLKRMLGL